MGIGDVDAADIYYQLREENIRKRAGREPMTDDVIQRMRALEKLTDGMSRREILDVMEVAFVKPTEKGFQKYPQAAAARMLFDDMGAFFRSKMYDRLLGDWIRSRGDIDERARLVWAAVVWGTDSVEFKHYQKMYNLKRVHWVARVGMIFCITMAVFGLGISIWSALQ